MVPKVDLVQLLILLVFPDLSVPVHIMEFVTDFLPSLIKQQQPNSMKIAGFAGSTKNRPLCRAFPSNRLNSSSVWQVFLCRLSIWRTPWLWTAAGHSPAWSFGYRQDNAGTRPGGRNRSNLHSKIGNQFPERVCGERSHKYSSAFCKSKVLFTGGGVHRRD